MAFPPGFLDELRSRLSLADYVGRRVRLVRKGREYSGLCPFHNEKTPSFYVVEDKGFFHCFGCGAHGDAIGFAMRADNLDFVEAVERLAGEAGLQVPQQTPQDRERAQRQKTLLEALAAAAAFYEARLWAPAGGRARDYLFGRGLDEDTIRRFRLGWASAERHALRQALAPEFPEALLVEAGLLRRPDNGGEAYDFFRERVIFPIGDRAGRPIAFGGRTIAADVQPKYLNSPEHPLFEKGRVLYGWSVARANAARELEAGGPGAIVTEGYMDVIALHRAGFGTAVAPLGTALTEAQLEELWKLAPEPVLCFDGDAAGQRAAIRALRRALPLLRPGHSLRFAALPTGEDPDSLLRSGGRLAVEEILAAAQAMSTKLWEIESGARPADTPERRAELERRLMENVGLISDRGVQFEYRRFLRDRLFDLARAGRGAPGRTASSFARRGGSSAPLYPHEGRPEVMPTAPGRRQREVLMRMLLQFPQLIEQASEEIAALDIPEPELDRLRREILEVEALRPGLDAEALRLHLGQNGYAATMDMLLSPAVVHAGFLSRSSDPELPRLGLEHVLGMIREGDRKELDMAADALGKDPSPETWKRFLALQGREAQDGFVVDELASNGLQGGRGESASG